MRTRKARLPDAPRIQELIETFSRRELLLPRSLDEICQNIHNFTVAVERRRVVGCGGLHFYGPDMAEVRSIAVDPQTQGHGAGQRIVRALLKEATQHGIRRICLFTHIPEFFARLGFVVVPHHTLPEKMFKDCLKCPRIHCCDEVAMVFGGAGAVAQLEGSRVQHCATGAAPHIQLRTLRG